MERSFPSYVPCASLHLGPGDAPASLVVPMMYLVPGHSFTGQGSVRSGFNVIIPNSANTRDNSSKVQQCSGSLVLDQNYIMLGTVKPFPSPLESGMNKITKAWE